MNPLFNDGFPENVESVSLMVEIHECKKRRERLLKAFNWLREFDPPAHRDDAIAHAMHVIAERINPLEMRIGRLEMELRQKERRDGFAGTQRTI